MRIICQFALNLYRLNLNVTSIYFRSVSSWFDEDGVLSFQEFLNDVVEICNNLKKEKVQ